MTEPTAAPSHPRRTGCAEGRAALSRRDLLRIAGAAGGLGLVGATLGDTRLAFGAPAATAVDTLVVLSLRGGVDGLSVLAPVGDPGYAAARPNIALPVRSVKQVGTVFGLHPALAPIYQLWDTGRIAAVHAVGQPAATRSHDEAMQAMELAAPASAGAVGWVDRMVGQIPGAGALTAAQVGTPNLPTALLGPHPNFAMGTLDNVKLEVSDSIVPLTGWQKALTLLHAGASAQVRGPVAAAMAAVSKAGAIPPAPTPVEAGYPSSALGQNLHDVARLITSGLGLRVATVDVHDWDMHQNMGRSDKGWMVDKLSDLATALAAFAKDLGPAFDRVTLVTLSEFGRRVAENGSGGTDHGHGNVVLIAGGSVEGGKVYGTWPTLASDKLADGDLAATTDYRQILAEVLTKRCGIASAAAVFPGFAAAPLGLVATRPTG
jgi:uncharacterized protein (DUF1501 family)